MNFKRVLFFFLLLLQILFNKLSSSLFGQHLVSKSFQINVYLNIHYKYRKEKLEEEKMIV